MITKPISIAMTRPLSCILVPATALTLNSCIVEVPGGPVANGTATQLPGNAPAYYGQPLTAVNGLGTVTIREGSRTVCSFRTASPNIEETRFINEQNQIVVKSRGNHGPATVQLFNTRTGRQEGTVMAYEIANGGPSWAAGMAE
jgi:hypothetical protein